MAQMVKNLPAIQETQVQSLGQEDPLEKGIGYPLQYSWGFPGGSDGKESAHNMGDPGSMPRSGSLLEFPWSMTG